MQFCRIYCVTVATYVQTQSVTVDGFSETQCRTVDRFSETQSGNIAYLDKTQSVTIDHSCKTCSTRISAVSAYLKLKMSWNEILTYFVVLRGPKPTIYWFFSNHGWVPLILCQSCHLSSCGISLLTQILQQEISSSTLDL